MNRWRLASAALVGTLAGLALAASLHQATSARSGAGAAAAERTASFAAVRGDPRPEFAHAGLDGRLWRASDFDGKPLLVNFWATWCRPCVTEIPLLNRLAAEPEGAVQVVGIAVDDPIAVRRFVSNFDIAYPILIGGADVYDTSTRFGNLLGGLPYTVLIDAQSRIRWRHLGQLDPRALEQALDRLATTPVVAGR